jgi:hypothetical protein
MKKTLLHLALAAASLQFTACRQPDESIAPQTQQTTQSQSITNNDPTLNQVPLAARLYINAVNQNNLDSLVSSFATNGQILDVSRTIAGQAAIRTWARNEVMGGTLRVIEINQQRPGHVRLLVHWAPRGSAGWRAWYTFSYENNRITLADLQYA